MKFLVIAMVSVWFSLFSASVRGYLLLSADDVKLARDNPNCCRNSAPYVIALIDTGIDWKNPALKKYLWTNMGESGWDEFGRSKSDNGIDDDHNGYVDDVHGWNFLANSNDISDDQGHGTHVAGILAQKLDEWVHSGADLSRVKLMPLKYYQRQMNSTDPLQASLEALAYAAKMHVSLINYSGGGFEASQVEKRLLQTLNQLAIPVISAAGNESANIDNRPYFPAAYRLPNVLSVGALNAQNGIAEFSNFGDYNLDVFAPGEYISSHFLQGTRAKMSGTSQATAYASAMVASLMIRHPDLSFSDIKLLLQTPSTDSAKDHGIPKRLPAMKTVIAKRGDNISGEWRKLSNRPELFIDTDGFSLSPSQDGEEKPASQQVSEMGANLLYAERR